MKQFKISFVVNEGMMTTIFSLLSGHVEKWSISEVSREERMALNGKKRTHNRFNQTPLPNPTAPGWVAAQEAVKKVKVGDDFTKDFITKEFKKAGRNPLSASPMLTHLVRAGFLQRPPHQGGAYVRLK